MDLQTSQGADDRFTYRERHAHRHDVAERVIVRRGWDFDEHAGTAVCVRVARRQSGKWVRKLRIQFYRTVRQPILQFVQL